MLTKCDGMLAHPVMYYDTLDIISLESDTLVLRLKGTKEKVRYIKTAAKK